MQGRSCPYVLSERVAYLIQIISRQKRLLAPVLHALFIHGLIMQREDRIDTFPFAMFRSDTSATCFFRDSDHMVDNAQTLRFRLGLR